MLTKEQLTEIRNKILKPQNWTQGTEARDTHGNWVSPFSPYATQFCLAGAAISLNIPIGDLPGILSKAIGEPVNSITEFNDNSEHHKVVKALDIAISQTTS